MGNQSGLHLWIMRAAYVLICCAFLIFHLIPIAPSATLAFSPDMILCLTLAWVARRPEYTPILLIALIGLLADLLLSRPPGLWAALILMLSEYIRNRSRRMRTAGFFWEWVRVSAGIAVIFFANRLALGVLLLDVPPFRASLMQYAATFAMYPVLVAVSSVAFRVSYPDIGDTQSDKARA